MQNVNYQKILEEKLKCLAKIKKYPSLLLHSCCAPCSSYVLEYLSPYFKITVFYYNPNIYPHIEYIKRVEEQKKFIEKLNDENNSNRFNVKFIEGDYDTEKYYDTVKGLENVKEGGERCLKCYELRLYKTANVAKQFSFDYFTTTLTISPLKNSSKINEIGGKIAKEYQINYLYSDFKKNEGFKRSIELSKEYELYRQDYCGCKFSVNRPIL